MDQNNQNQSGTVPPDSTDLGSVRKDSATFGNVPNDAESFGRVPHDSESFRSVPHASERKENHTVTLRDAARMFETAGVARTERSITNWCQPNKLGIARLNAYFDPNERRYFITPQSIQLAIQEEKAKAVKDGEPSEPGASVPKDSERRERTTTQPSEDDSEEVEELQKQIRDLEITNRVKDMFVAQLQKDREHFELERKDYIEQLMSFNRKVGELETKLLQIESSTNR